MLRALIPLALASALFCALPAHAQDSGLADPSTYRSAQDYMLQLINEQRGYLGLAGVRLDHSASEAGRRHAEEMLAAGFTSHWNLAGFKPTRRFNLLGGFHSVGENIYYAHNPYDDCNAMVDEAMVSFLASPGHRRTILDPTYTHVGLALAQSGRDFYVCQEFTSQVGGEYSCPLYCKTGDTVQFAGRYDPGTFDLEMVLLAWEELPEARKPLWLNKTAEYHEGELFIAGYMPDATRQFQDMPTFHDIVVDSRRGYFRCDARLDYEGRAGLYYLTLWLREKRSGQQVHAATATVLVE